jgi:hypothetical protein
VQRPRVGDDQHASEAEPIQGLPVALKFSERHAFVDTACLEEAVKLSAGAEAEQAPQLGTRQPTSAVFLGRKGLQCPARDIVWAAQPGRQIVWDGQGDIHCDNLGGSQLEGKSRMIKDVIMRDIDRRKDDW